MSDQSDGEDKGTDKKVSEIILFYVLLFEASSPGYDAIPSSPLSMIIHMAADHAKKLHESTIDVFTASHGSQEGTSDFDIVGDHIPPKLLKSEEFLICHNAMCNGFLATQFCLRGHWKAMDVEFDTLKRALVNSLQDPIEAHGIDGISGNLHIARLVTTRALGNSKSKYAKFIDENFMCNDMEKADSLDLAITMCVALGVAIWHLADNIQSAQTATGARRKKIFISYSHKDKGHAETFQTILDRAGYNVWRDVNEIQVGSSIAGSVARAISFECDYVVLLISKNSLESSWVVDEIEQAVLRERKEGGKIFLLPVRLDDSKIPSNLTHIEVKRYGDARSSIQTAAEQVIAALESYDASRN